MRTCMTDLHWFKPEVTDRLRFYFSSTPTKPAGTVFHYDSTGSYVLGCLVERLSGRNLPVGASSVFCKTQKGCPLPYFFCIRIDKRCEG